MSGFALRQNCSCNARRSKSNARINDTYRRRAKVGGEGMGYAYVANCIHIGPAGMGISLWDCLSIRMYIEVIGKDCEERLQPV